MVRYKLVIEYDGTDFHGWQRQACGLISLQSCIEDAIRTFTGCDVVLFCAGRTDAGVHAIGQVAHFDIAHPIDCFRFCQGVNAILRPMPISIVSVVDIDDDFHARFSAVSKKYRYTILNRAAPSVFLQRRAWHIYTKLNIADMIEAASSLLGHHDFTSFCAKYDQSSRKERTIDSIDINMHEDGVLYLDYVSRSFLHHQVRIMTGTLQEVGSGKRTVASVADALEQKSRRAAGVTAPAHGLTLVSVSY